MKPAFSVLVFTVVSGFGYGLLMWFFVYELLLGSSAASQSVLIELGLGLLLATLGLLSSTLHLANPKNAWRAFSRFRTSWLSREGVFALLMYPLVALYLVLLWFMPETPAWVLGIIALLNILNAFAVVYCTGKIYASLKPIRQWHHPLVVPIYLLLSLVSGGLLIMVSSLLLNLRTGTALELFFLLSAGAALLLKLMYFISIGRSQGVSIASATSLGASSSQAAVRLLDTGHSAGNFLTKEFVFNASAEKLTACRYLSLMLALLLPILGLLLLPTSLTLLIGLSVCMLSGLLLERWLFFAEARHSVRLYHGDTTT